MAKNRSSARKLEASGERKAPLRAVAGSGGDGDPLALDKLIHERMRLAIVSTLAVSASVSFNDLKGLVGATDGNLSVHARKLEEAGYISCTKSFEDRIPHTEFALTAKGRKALECYLDHMEGLIRATRNG